MADMTNDELHELDDDAFEQMAAEQDNPVDEVIEDNTVDEPVSEGSTEEVVEETSEHAEPEDEAEEVSETEEDTLESTETEEESEEEDPHNGQEPQPEDEDTEQPSKEVDELDYKAMYEDMMGPVKVGGKEFKVKSIEDAKKLLGMGFSFSDNMRGVKPLRAVGKTLEDAGIIVNGVVNEQALTRLIDIQNGDKNALAQLMSEKEIDPLDVETEDINYIPTASMATEQSIDIQEIEKELVSRGSVDAVVTELDKLDSKSKEFFNSDPRNLLMLDDDIASGTYEQLMGSVQYEKSLGRLAGMSDIEAYIQLASSQQQPAQEVPQGQPAAQPSSAKRKAAGISKRAPAKKKTQKSPDYVNMSDEEFEKIAMNDNYVY